mmetsp:Transcript_32379/g.82565  ORF Transcript_32379/g.82565 Transcript_32379/m.82565 type:complete len:361 (-) Transcript_32379:3080-4162(-)
MVGLAPVRRRWGRLRHHDRGSRGHIVPDVPLEALLQHGKHGVQRPGCLRPRGGQPVQHLRHVKLWQLGAERQAHRLQRRARGAPRGGPRRGGDPVFGDPLCRLKLPVPRGGEHQEPLHAPLGGGVEPRRLARVQFHGRQRDIDDGQPPKGRAMHLRRDLVHCPHPLWGQRRGQRVPAGVRRGRRRRVVPLRVGVPLGRDLVRGLAGHLRGVHRVPPRRGACRRGGDDHGDAGRDLDRRLPRARRGALQQQRGALHPRRAQRGLPRLVHDPVGGPGGQLRGLGQHPGHCRQRHCLDPRLRLQRPLPLPRCRDPRADARHPQADGASLLLHGGAAVRGGGAHLLADQRFDAHADHHRRDGPR